MTSIPRKPVADPPAQDLHVRNPAEKAAIFGPAEALRHLEGREPPAPDTMMTAALPSTAATTLAIPPVTNPFEFHDDSSEEEFELQEAKAVFGVVKTFKHLQAHVLTTGTKITPTSTSKIIHNHTISANDVQNSNQKEGEEEELVVVQNDTVTPK
jgi:hypothetical protein